MRYRILFLMLFFSLAILAQESKKKFLLGGDFNFFSSVANNPNESNYNRVSPSSPVLVSNLERKVQTFSIDVRIGKYIGKNSVIGLNASFNNSDENDTGNIFLVGQSPLFQSDYNRFDIGLFYRQQITFIRNLKFFLQPEISYAHTKVSSLNYRSLILDSSIAEGIQLNLDGGICYTFNSKWNLLVSIPVFDYIMLINKEDHDEIEEVFLLDRSSNYDFGVNLREIRIGVERLF